MPRHDEDDEPDFDQQAEAFRQTLDECEALYRTAAEDCARPRPDLSHDPSVDFPQRMLDLHRGLVTKIFVEVAHANWHWSDAELVLARELFEHNWNRRLTEKQLREALSEILTKTHLNWESLVGPFERLRPLRKYAPRLKQIAGRLANQVAAVEGRMTPEKLRQVQWIQSQMSKLLDPVPIAEALPYEPEKPSGRQVMRQAHSKMQPEYELEPARGALVMPRSTEEELQAVLAELDALIGLSGIKQEVRGLVNFLKIQREREKHGLPRTQVALHSVFSGNPGTGKTTVARLLGRIFGTMGILAKGHLVEVDRSGLVAEFAGQTGPKTNKRIDEALDGVLFIDEAYSLVAQEGDDPYGTEALQTLLKRMEDERNRLVVVIAGYPEPMKDLMDTNPGIESRFTRLFSFPDYTASELGLILHGMCKQNHYDLPSAARAKLLLGFQHLLNHKTERFGNGRLARNTFEMAIRRLANRVAGGGPLTREILSTLLAEDIVLDGVPAETFKNLADDSRCFRVVCPGCQQNSRLPQRLLGERVQCKRCQHEFNAEWGEVLTNGKAEKKQP